MHTTASFTVKNPADMPDKVDWYVYYRANSAQAFVLQSRVQAMQQRLLHEYGINGQLKRRPQVQKEQQEEQQHEQHTWMEVYLDVPDNFDAILTNEVMRAGLSDLINGERHVEHFWDITSCA